jgi:hypothetical protein
MIDVVQGLATHFISLGSDAVGVAKPETDHHILS